MNKSQAKREAHYVAYLKLHNHLANRGRSLKDPKVRAAFRQIMKDHDKRSEPPPAPQEEK